MELFWNVLLSFILGWLFFRSLRNRRVPRALYYQGNTYVRIKKTPCPQKGWEKALVLTNYGGKPAYWSDGWLYVITSISQGVSSRRKTFVDRNKELGIGE